MTNPRLPPGTTIPGRDTFKCPCGKALALQLEDGAWRCIACALVYMTATDAARPKLAVLP